MCHHENSENYYDHEVMEAFSKEMDRIEMETFLDWLDKEMASDEPEIFIGVKMNQDDMKNWINKLLQ